MKKRQAKKNGNHGCRRNLSWSDRVFIDRMFTGREVSGPVRASWDHDAVVWERKYSGWTRTRHCQCHSPAVLIDGEQGGDLGLQVKPPSRRRATQGRR